MMAGLRVSIATVSATPVESNTSINFNAPLISVTGDVGNVADLEQFVKEAEAKITSSILEYVR